VLHNIMYIIIKSNCQRSNQIFTMQTSLYLGDKLLNVFLNTNKGGCGQQLLYTTNVNWNEHLTLFRVNQI
jgi:hypothetical protein